MGGGTINRGMVGGMVNMGWEEPTNIQLHHVIIFSLSLDNVAYMQSRPICGSYICIFY